MPGIIHARLSLNRNRARVSPGPDPFVSEWEKMFNLGKQALQTFIHIRDSGFVPDVICCAFSDGTALFLRHAFPHAFIVSYFNGFRGSMNSHEERMRLQAVMDLQRCTLSGSNLYFVRSETQREAFPPALHSLIRTWPPCVNTDFFSPQQPDFSAFFPDIAPDSAVELLTMHMKGAESSFRDMAQVILGVLMRRPHCLICLAFGRGRAREHWEQARRSLPESIGRRLFLTDGLDSLSYRNLLCSSTIHVFPEPVWPPLQEMLESMSCETLLLTPETGQGFSRDKKTSCALPANGSAMQLETICHILDNINDFQEIRKNARQMVVENHQESTVLSHHLRVIMQAYADSRTGSKEVGSGQSVM